MCCLNRSLINKFNTVVKLIDASTKRIDIKYGAIERLKKDILNLEGLIGTLSKEKEKIKELLEIYGIIVV